MKAVNALIGVVVSAAAGLLLGVLFAPEKGSNTRKKIIRKGEAQVDAVKKKFNGLIDGVSENYDKIKKDVSGLAKLTNNSKNKK